MKNMSQAAQGFLSQKRIAVVGVSRTGRGAACAIFRGLRETGRETYAVNVTLSGITPNRRIAATAVDES